MMNEMHISCFETRVRHPAASGVPSVVYPSMRFQFRLDDAAGVGWGLVRLYSDAMISGADPICSESSALLGRTERGTPRHVAASVEVGILAPQWWNPPMVLSRSGLSARPANTLLTESAQHA